MISAENLSIQFDKKVILSFPKVQLSDNEQCVLLGESGTGKTTLMYMIAGLLRPDQGSIHIDDTDISLMSQSQLDRYRGQNIGLIFQKNYLINSLNVYDNIALAQRLAGLSVDAELIDHMLKELSIYDKKSSRIKSLSHGQAQRVAITRSLINNPKLILADEPTASLDDKHAIVVIEMLKRQAEKCAANLIIATHDQRVKEMFAKEIILHKNENALA